MSLPTRLLLSLTIASVSLALSGCGTIYSDVYSPRPNHFVPPVKKSTIEIVPNPPAPGDTTPANPLPSSTPLTPPAMPLVPADPAAAAAPAPAIPGL